LILDFAFGFDSCSTMESPARFTSDPHGLLCFY
jgi:hypothetical protein